MFSLLRGGATAKPAASKPFLVKDGLDSGAVDNKVVINRLNELMYDTTYDAKSLTTFCDLFFSRFNWIAATPDEITSCKAIVLDLVSLDGEFAVLFLQRLVKQFRSSDKEHLKVDICDITFDSVLSLKKHLRRILINSVPNVDIQGEDFKLLLELLRYHPRGGNLQDDVVSIFSSQHRNPKYNGLHCFFYRHRQGYCVDFSYARCADNVKTRGEIFRDYMCDVAIEMYKLFPNLIGSSLLELIDGVYPHHNIGIEHHVSVAKAILYIAKHVESLRGALYRLLIVKLTIIDAEIKLADPNAVDVDKVEALRSEKLRELADQLKRGDINLEEAKATCQGPNWFDSIYEKIRTEEDNDDQSQKLDILLAIFYEKLQNVLGYYSRVAINGSDVNSAVKAEVGGTCTPPRRLSAPAHCRPLDDSKSPSVLMRSIKREAVETHKTAADLIVVELLETFEQVILPTYNCKYVQFVYFFVFAYNHKWAKWFIHRLFGVVFDETAPVTRRRTAAAYIASLICRAKYISSHVVCNCVGLFFRALVKFDFILADANTVKYYNNGHANLSLFYSLVQDILYIVCYHSEALSRSERCISLLQGGTRSFLSFLDCYLKPLSYVKHNIIVQAIVSTEHFAQLRPLHKYLLQVRQTLHIDNGNEDEMDWLLYSPIDSIFPFDPYLLHHSNFYIRDKYRNHVPVKKETALVKREPDGGLQGVGTGIDSMVNAVMEAINEHQPINKEICKSAQDTAGFSAVSRVVKATLDSKRREMDMGSQKDIEVDYDFWGFDFASSSDFLDEDDVDGDDSTCLGTTRTLDSSCDSSSCVASARSSSLHGPGGTKRLCSSPPMPTSEFPMVSERDLLGLSQLDDLDLTISGEVQIHLKKQSTFFDDLVKSAAYKSAIQRSKRVALQMP